jgi:transcriptional regulator with XRE-family HTH domain
MVVVVTMTDNDSSSGRGSSVDVGGLARFGDEVRRRRKALGLTLVEFGKRCGLTWNYVRGIENGRRNPSLSTIHSIAEGFRIHPGELLGSVHDLSPVCYEAARVFAQARPEVQDALVRLLHVTVKKPRT